MPENASKQVEKTSRTTPKKHAKRNPRKIVQVPRAEINVPRERVTSVWDPDLANEFMESVKAKGILKPLDLIDVDGDLWLTDGLHRLVAAEKLEIPTVPCRIKKGTLEDLLIENILMNRQRGKSNPAQEAETLHYLTTTRGFPLENAAKQLGFTLAWAKKLIRVASLPDEAKDLIKHGKIPITGAFYITDLPNPTEQLSLAKQAADWNYTVYQIKTAVGNLLNPDKEPEEGSYTFNAGGKPQRIPITCRYCGATLPERGAPYVWCCEQCDALARELIEGYTRALAEQTKGRAQTE